MGFSDRRQAARDEETTTDRFDFTMEQNSWPDLHEGFTEPCKGQPDKSVLIVSVYFSGGAYQAIIRDRQADEKCFVECGNLHEVGNTIEAGLQDNSLIWKPDRASRNGQ